MVTHVFGNKGKKIAVCIVTGLMLLPQRLILGPLLFNNFIDNIFLFIKKSHIYANLVAIIHRSFVETISQ